MPSHNTESQACLRAGRLKRPIAPWLVATALLLCGGCSPKWQAFEQIEPGKPLPPDCLLKIHGQPSEYTQEYTDARAREWQITEVHWRSDLHLPSLDEDRKGPKIAEEWTAAAVDPNGRVVAKAYNAFSVIGWPLIGVMKQRYVMDLAAIPCPRDPNDPNGSWVDPYRLAFEAAPGLTNPLEIGAILLGVIPQEAALPALAALPEPEGDDWEIYFTLGTGGTIVVEPRENGILRVSNHTLFVGDPLGATVLLRFLTMFMRRPPEQHTLPLMRRPPSGQRWMPPGGPRRVRFPRPFREVRQR
ncbi:MAG: hypothetical protein ACLFV7_05850 [Phycisphaerae bacterium]